MIAALMGVPGKLKTLLDRLTAARAGYLDNLSAGAVAQAGTALSNGVWTNALAAELDGLAPSVAAIPTTPINSIQYGTVVMALTASGTATITAVTVAKSALIWLGASLTGSTSDSRDLHARITLTNTTTITATRGNGGGTMTVSFVVVEFK